MRSPQKRALLGVLSISAVTASALGISYLGLVSYSSDRGRVAAAVDEQVRLAQRVASAIESDIEDAVSLAEELFERTAAPAPSRIEDVTRQSPLAAFPLRLSVDGEVLWPLSDPFSRRSAFAVAADDSPPMQPRSCPDENFEGCVRQIRESRRRAQRFERALARERAACVDGDCNRASLLRSASDYQVLATTGDLRAAALVSLARVSRRLGRTDRARAAYVQLAAKFPRSRDAEGVAYGLLAGVGIAALEQTPAAYRSVAESILSGRYPGGADVLLPIFELMRERLGNQTLAGSEIERGYEALTFEVARSDALPAAVQQLVGDASARLRGRQIEADEKRAVVYRRSASGDVVGLLLSEKQLADAAERHHRRLDARQLSRRVEVLLVNQTPDPETTRTLASVTLGSSLPHLSLALVNSATAPDPLDEIVDAQGRRHLWFSGGLAIILMLGMAATIRGAARERELARLKSDFVSTVSHELKTPLTSVRMFAEMLRQGVAEGDADKEARYQDVIVKESERLGLLIANLLDYSQVERGTRRYARTRVLADELVGDAVTSVLRLRDHRGPEISTRNQCEGAVVEVDREVVVQCLINLLSNACKYGGDGEVVIASRVVDAGVLFSVADRGPGLSRSELGKVWQEFYRAPAAYKAGVEGTGLGLALVKRHIEEQGGRVAVTSVEGEGATFSIWLPLATSEREDSE